MNVIYVAARICFIETNRNDSRCIVALLSVELWMSWTRVDSLGLHSAQFPRVALGSIPSSQFSSQFKIT